MRYLIVDDNTSTRALIRHYLQRFGIETFEACNGYEGLQHYIQYTPDWIVMDIEMPIMDGIDAAQQILATSSDAQILLMSSNRSPEIQQASQSIGIYKFVSKSSIFTELGKTLLTRKRRSPLR